VRLAPLLGDPCFPCCLLLGLACVVAAAPLLLPALLLPFPEALLLPACFPAFFPLPLPFAALDLCFLLAAAAAPPAAATAAGEAALPVLILLFFAAALPPC
jgi:hypothetical protein